MTLRRFASHFEVLDGEKEVEFLSFDWGSHQVHFHSADNIDFHHKTRLTESRTFIGVNYCRLTLYLSFSLHSEIRPIKDYFGAIDSFLRTFQDLFMTLGSLPF